MSTQIHIHQHVAKTLLHTTCFTRLQSMNLGRTFKILQDCRKLLYYKLARTQLFSCNNIARAHLQPCWNVANSFIRNCMNSTCNAQIMRNNPTTLVVRILQATMLQTYKNLTISMNEHSENAQNSCSDVASNFVTNSMNSILAMHESYKNSHYLCMNVVRTLVHLCQNVPHNFVAKPAHSMITMKESCVNSLTTLHECSLCYKLVRTP